VTELVLRPLAEADLDSIWEYTFANWGAAQARRYLGELREVFDEIARGLRTGRQLEGKHAGILRYRMRSHLIIYRKTERLTEVVRVLHQSMDIERHL
jgi:toxin ParE1/3/4